MHQEYKRQECDFFEVKYQRESRIADSAFKCPLFCDKLLFRFVHTKSNMTCFYGRSDKGPAVFICFHGRMLGNAMAQVERRGGALGLERLVS